MVHFGTRLREPRALLFPATARVMTVPRRQLPTDLRLYSELKGNVTRTGAQPDDLCFAGRLTVSFVRRTTGRILFTHIYCANRGDHAVHPGRV